jgi:hypothetical protein
MTFMAAGAVYVLAAAAAGWLADRKAGRRWKRTVSQPETVVFKYP